MTIIAEQIAKYREFIGYSDQQLIELTKIPEQRFIKIINGESEPYLKQIMTISEVLIVPLRYFLDPSKDYSFEYHLCWLDDIL